MLRILSYVLVLALLATGVIYGYPLLFGAGSADAGAGRQTVVPVVVSTLRIERFEDSLEALGTLKANESVLVTPNLSDHIMTLHFEDGQQVEKGQLLAELTVGEELALLGEASALRDDQKLRFEQVEELYAKEMSSQRELNNNKALLAAAEARVLRLQAQIDDHKVLAPFAGTLGFRRVSAGAFVDPKTTIATLDDLSVMKLDFTVPETYMAALSRGMAVQARSDAWPAELFEGSVLTVDTQVDPKTRAVTARAVIPNPDGKLRPGMLMKLKVVRSVDEVLLLPEEALIPSDRDQRVFLLDSDDVARLTTIKIGRRRRGAAEVLEGLEVGDRVVVEGVVRVRDNQQVRVTSNRNGTEQP
ncbi:MAG: efflux RND transporter periplasmic adaptor subunit [Planctomycetota bacterium]|jgi:membrane fusion protein (multidrug efflux system)